MMQNNDVIEKFEAFCEFLKKYAELEETVIRQNVEIEMLTSENAILRGYIGIETDEQISQVIANYKGVIAEAKAEAIKEFAERLKSLVTPYPECDFKEPITRQQIDNLVKEMAGDTE